MGHDYYDYMKDMYRHYRTLFDEMGRDEQGYYYWNWKQSAGASWESAEPAEPQERQEPQTTREKLEQAEFVECEVVDDMPMVLGYAH